MYQGFNFIAVSATLVIDDQNNISGFTVAPRNSRSGGALVSLLECEQPKRSLNDSYRFQLQQRCSKDQWELVGTTRSTPRKPIFLVILVYVMSLRRLQSTLILFIIFFGVICKYFVII